MLEVNETFVNIRRISGCRSRSKMGKSAVYNFELPQLAFATDSDPFLGWILADRDCEVDIGTRSENSATNACGSFNSLLNTSRPIACAAGAMYFSIGPICTASLT